VAQGLGVGIVPAGARHLKVHGVSYIPIRDMPKSLDNEITLAWVPRSVSTPLRTLISLIEKISREQP
jgi:DNA-binding transcriptional LysR family regulator